MNTSAVADMLEGKLLPPTVTALCSVLAVTLISTKTLLKDWLNRTFCVQWEAVHDALRWLQANNPLYENIQISMENLNVLLENSVPVELEAVMRYKEDVEMARQEREGYAMNEEEEDEGMSQTYHTQK